MAQGATDERAPRGGAARLTSRAFTDLGLWMLGLGVAIGVAFPFVLPPLGIPSELTLRPTFFVATVFAGLMLAAANYRLARWVVGSRLDTLSRQMRRVSGVIGEATYSGDWAGCTPEACQLPVDSADEFGEGAASFNELVSALAESREVQQAMAEHSRVLAEHLDLSEFTAAALGSFLTASGGEAGAFAIVRDGELEMSAAHRMSALQLQENPTVLAALTAGSPMWMSIPADLDVDAAVTTFRPASVAILPIPFRSVPLGVLVLAFARAPHQEAARLVEAMRASTGVALNNVISHERFQRLAAIDPLTGAYNRRFGLSRLHEEWARSLRSEVPLGVLAFDLDHFKAVNDTYGHLVGDRVLRETTAAARLALREGDVLVRTGGEEFLVVLPGGGVDDVSSVGERLRRAVSGVAVPAGQGTVTVTVSVGAASFPHCAADDPEGLMEIADQALYAAKESGRDRLTVGRPATGRVPSPTR